ncbi:retron Ec67 family RNA-directed DNA polymerase/endonuclease [Micavibrio aeruginosavorus]|uniref:RNA-directed DNA polymerase n=1 Tax=Micavibrio aeruginosavorus (strain ARL-13) TaxID=856793 RepID=G2KQ19_MICAA|nr:retron Ec67 family RNA-directed DNA polymerase/endonuclease [Micavibrio aeruginosavorus]AEP10387.1 reverse transcriptase family protein [Micavibrio aeruginosavorus ARL-13]
MSKLAALKSANSVSDLARLLKSKPDTFAYFLYKVPEKNKYTSFSIPKKTGGERKIDAPSDQLSYIQKQLAKYLQDCIEEIGELEKQKLGKKKFSSAAHGFTKDRSIITNARPHRRKRWVLNLDLKDFFPSINFGRIRGFFIKNKNFNLDPDVASAIAHICCYEGKLPQGSPCSPIISNLIGHLLDVRLIKIAKKYSCTYTRYADDITFSSDLRKFPKEIAHKKLFSKKSWELSNSIKQEIEKSGFFVNEKKTRMQYQESRQDVTSLVVNKKVNVKRELYKTLRAQCHTLFRTGGCYEIAYQRPENEKISYLQRILDKIFYRPKKIKEKKEDRKYKTLDQIQGMLNFVYQVRHDRDKKLGIAERKEIESSIKSLYRKFLFFINFYYIDRPLIICEGKTDPIYLKCALKSLHLKYPGLIEKTSEGFDFRIKFFTYSDTTLDILNLGGGCGDLAKLIREYNESCTPYKCSGLLHPVIIIVDNDNEPTEKLFPAIKGITHSKTPILGDKPFYTVTRNLYVIPIPQKNGKSTCIEHYFEESVFDKDINGRKFHPDKGPADGFSCSKNDFAEKIICKQQGSINFSMFSDIFDKIVDVTIHYRTRRSSP